MVPFVRFIYQWNLAGHVVWRSFTSHTALRNSFYGLSRIITPGLNYTSTSWCCLLPKSHTLSKSSGSQSIQGRLSVEDFHSPFPSSGFFPLLLTASCYHLVRFLLPLQFINQHVVHLLVLNKMVVLWKCHVSDNCEKS